MGRKKHSLRKSRTRTAVSSDNATVALVKELNNLNELVNPYIHNFLLSRLTPILNKYRVNPPPTEDSDMTELLREFIVELMYSNPANLLERMKPKLKLLLSKRRIIETQITSLVKRLEEMKSNFSEENGDIDELVLILTQEDQPKTFKPVYESKDWVNRFKEVIRRRNAEKSPIEENPDPLLDPMTLQELEDKQKTLRGKENAIYLSELAELYKKKYDDTEDISRQLLESLMSLKKGLKGSTKRSTLSPSKTSKALNLFAISYERWTYMVKSHALYVSSSLQDGAMRDEYIGKAIDIHKQTVSNMNEQTLRDNIGSNIKTLNTLREDHKTIVEELDNLSASVDITNSNNDPEFIQSLSNFSKRGESLLCQVSEETKSFVRSMMSQSVASFSIDFPLCVFAIGSLARNEATSFSDIEFGFLVDDCVAIDELLCLSLDMFYRLNYLGESNLKTFDIAELKDCGFSDEGRKGVRIDGISSKAGNMPTGNGLDPGSELCFGVSSFLNKISCAINNPHEANSKNVQGSNFADMAAYTTIVWANNEGKDIYHKMKSQVSQLSQTEQSKSARISLLESDMKKFKFLPNLSTSHSGQIDVKDDIYRYLSLYFAGVNNSLSWNCETNFHCIRKMRESSLIVDDESMRVLQYLLVCSLYARLAAYSHYGQQCDSITVFKTDSQSQLYSINSNTFTSLMSYTVPLKESLPTTLSKSDNTIKPIPSITHDNLTATSTTLFYKASYYEVISMFEKKFGDSLSPDSMNSDQSEILMMSLYASRSLTARHSSLIKSVYGDDSDMYVYYMGAALQSTQPGDALVRFQRSERTWHDDQNKLFDVHCSIAECYLRLGEYTQCREALDKSERLLNTIDSDVLERNIMRCSYLSTRGSLEYKLGNYSLFLAMFTERLCIYHRFYGNSVNHFEAAITLNEIGLAYQNIGKRDLAHRYHNESLSMHNNLYCVGPGVNNEDKASTLLDLGDLYAITGDYTKSLEYLNQSYDMMRIVHTHNPNHPKIALCSAHIADCYRKQNQYGTALDWYIKEFLVYHSQSDNNVNKRDYNGCMRSLCQTYERSQRTSVGIKSNYFQSLYVLGEHYYQHNQWGTAIEWYEKCIHSYQSQSDNDVNKSNYARCLYRLGLCNYYIRQYNTALEWYKRWIDSGEDVHDYAVCLYELGQCYWRLKQYDTAVEWYSKSLSNQSPSEKGVNRDNYAKCLYMLGGCYDNLGQYETAVKFCMRSLGIYQPQSDNEVNKNDYANCLCVLGNCYVNLGQYETAVKFYMQSLGIYQLQSDNEVDKHGYAVCLHQLGWCYYELNQYETSAEWYMKSFHIYESQSDNEVNRRNYANCLCMLGNCYDKLGQYETAVDWHMKSRRVRQ